MSKDWWKLGAVIAIAVVLAGLGSVIASRFDPLPESTAPAAAASQGTTTTIPLPAVTEAPAVTIGGSPTTTTPPAAPAVLELADDVVDFGEAGETAELQFTNSGGAGASWVIGSSNPSISVTPREGEVGPGEVVSVSVSLDRATVEEGELNSDLTVGWEGGELTVTVIGVHTDNPILHSPKASPSTVQAATGSTCSPITTTITVRVRDSSELAEVLVRWNNGSKSVETTMNAVDEENYRAVIGPFSAAGSPSIKIVARDVHDNAGGAPVALTVAACP